MKFKYTISILLCLSSAYLQGTNYVIQDLGTLNTEASHAISINNQNVVIGYFQQDENIEKFIWDQKNSGLTFLPIIDSRRMNSCNPKLNNNNQVADIFLHADLGWFIDTFTQRISIYDKGDIQEIDFPKTWKDYGRLSIVAFNENQQMLVTCDKGIAVWQNGTFTEIDSSALIKAYGMNNQGLIIGTKQTVKDGNEIKMVGIYNFMDDSFIEITKDTGFYNLHINDRNEVIFFKLLPLKGFFWNPTNGFVELANFLPMAFNNCGQIVGMKVTNSENPSDIEERMVPVMWSKGEFAPISILNDDQSLWNKSVPKFYGLNDNGYIVYDSKTPEGKSHAFLLVPQ
ncbi:MAG: hypothetical protein H0X51_00230 [Parachlamydiaceae bacterium]|nr:hypothetical protein [Parachlamydiaceae bacterium]